MKELSEEDNDESPQLLYERRIFVGGLSKECNEKLLFESFSKYGKIQDLDLVQHQHKQIHGHRGVMKRNTANLNRKRERPSFAFITFESKYSASNAIKLSQNPSSNSPHYSLVREAVPPKRQNQTKFKAKMKNLYEQERKRYLAIEESCDKCTVILQAHTSHLDRLVDYLPTLRSSSLEIQVTGTVSTQSDNISLVMVNCNHPVQLTEKLWSYNPILDRMALNKSYVVNPKLQNRQDIVDTRQILQDLLISSIKDLQIELSEVGKYSPSEPIVLKIQAFPPKLLQKIAVSTMDKILNGFEENDWKDTSGVEWSMSPKLEECTHMISCVMLHEGLQSVESVDRFHSALYMIGNSPISYEGLSPTRSVGVKDEVSRAYYKLKEAFERYDIDSSVSFNFEGKVAFDCGTLYRCVRLFSNDRYILNLFFVFVVQEVRLVGGRNF